MCRKVKTFCRHLSWKGDSCHSLTPWLSPQVEQDILAASNLHTFWGYLSWESSEKTLLQDKVVKTLQWGETKLFWLRWCENLTTRQCWLPKSWKKKILAPKVWRQFWLERPYKEVKHDDCGSHGAKTLRQDNFGSINLTRGWNKKFLAPMVRKPYNKTILAP